MIAVAAHPIDLDRIRSQDLPNELEMLARQRSIDETHDRELDADQLGAQLNALYGAIDRFVGGDPNWREMTYWAKAFTRGSAALFTYHRRPSRNHWRLRGHDRELTGASDPSAFGHTKWLNAFWLAFALRDGCSLALLLQTPVTLIEATEEYQRPTIAAIQSTFARLPGTATRIVEALALTDPEKTIRTWPAALLNLIVPVFEPLFAIADRDQARFIASLRTLLELRRAYYLRDKYDEGEAWNGRDEDNLSAPAVGLVAWARTLGMTVDVESGYAPSQLLAVQPRELETCRACLTPCDDDDRKVSCHACDAPRENTLAFGFADWVALQRQPCVTCGHPFPILARTCPVCLTSR